MDRLLQVGRRGVLIGILAAMAALPARSTALEPRSNRVGEKYALLVGVRRYDPNELRSLPYSEPDVDELARVLKGQGYQPRNVVLMTQTLGGEDPRFAPEAAKIRRELELLLDGLEEEDTVLVALAGHGVQFRGEAENYFCPSDARLADRRTLVPLGEIYRTLEGCRAGLKLLLVDACRNDPQSDNSRSRSVVSLESVTRPQRTPPPGGVVAFFSCSEGEKAYEHAELKHGVFFHYVIEGLKGAAAAAGEPEVLIPDLEKYVKRQVRDFVREKYGERQRPELRGTSRELVPLVRLMLSREDNVGLQGKAREPASMSPRMPARARVVIPAPPSLPTEDLKEALTSPSTGMKLVRIPAGEFLMGSPDDEKGADSDEKPKHRVRITRPFYLGATEVTQKQYLTVTGENPSESKGSDDSPVEKVSWDDAVAFCNKLSDREGLGRYYRFGDNSNSGGNGYRLPTEAEWEYACRAGATTRYHFGDAAGSLGEFAWFTDNSAGKPHPVASKPPNAFGLFDTHGNVWEWCWDRYSSSYNEALGVDPTGSPTGAERVIRGGGFSDGDRYCRATHRGKWESTTKFNYIGFRVARSPSGP